jgi:cytochrome d ubiquinol oxidase subunit II
MIAGTILFAVCSLFCIVGALIVILSRNPIRGAMGLLATIVGIAGLFLRLNAEFLAAMQLLVYAGAVVILFVFVVMLLGLILRGVAFDFRVKARITHKARWDRLFFAGSTLAAMSQGWMLGRYISGFGSGWNYPLFAAAIAVALPMAYVLLGATWLIMKTEGELQAKAVSWARIAWPPMVGGLALISLATPWISATVRDRWFSLPALIALLAVPLMTAVLLIAVWRLLPTRIVRGELCWLPFVLLILVFLLGFLGLAYSIYPFVVIDRLTIWQAASSPAALKVILIGVAISVPAIAAYTVFSYRVFRGKASALRYA